MSASEGTRRSGSTGQGARARLLAGLSVSESRPTLAGVSTAVLEGGDGPPLVLLHGPGESAVNWFRVLPELTRTHRVVAPDLPGQGESETASLDADGVLAWLDALIEHTCASPPVLVGHVVGGSLAARYAVGHQGRVRGLVLVDSLGLARFRPAPSFALSMAGFLAHPSERSYDRFMRRCSHDLDGLVDDMGDRWEPFKSYNLDRARTPSVRSATRQLVTSVGIPPIPTQDLTGLKIPVALIWGRHDLGNRLSIAQEASARYGWPLHVIEDCADDPARDRPDEFLAALGRALITPSSKETSR